MNQRPTTWTYPGYLALYMLASVGLDWLSGVGSTRWTHLLVGGTVVIIPLAVFMLLHGYIDMRRRLDTTAELLRLQEQRSRQLLSLPSVKSAKQLTNSRSYKL